MQGHDRSRSAVINWVWNHICLRCVGNQWRVPDCGEFPTMEGLMRHGRHASSWRVTIAVIPIECDLRGWRSHSRSSRFQSVHSTSRKCTAAISMITIRSNSSTIPRRNQLNSAEAEAKKELEPENGNPSAHAINERSQQEMGDPRSYARFVLRMV